MITEISEAEQRRLIEDLARELADTAGAAVKDIARPLATLLAINGAINALGILVRLDPDPVGTAKAAEEAIVKQPRFNTPEGSA
jgi:hypothetical protein